MNQLWWIIKKDIRSIPFQKESVEDKLRDETDSHNIKKFIKDRGRGLRGLRGESVKRGIGRGRKDKDSIIKRVIGGVEITSADVWNTGPQNNIKSRWTKEIDNNPLNGPLK